MSAHGRKLDSGQGPGSCGLGGCFCHGHPSDATGLSVRERNTMPPLSRRHLFGATLGGAAAAMLSGIGTELAAPGAASAQSTLSPDDALKSLMDGNQRFVERRLTSFQEDIDMLMQHSAEKQEPFASVLACADSRVPVELVFDQSIGHVFVNRIAGNIATSEIIASIEYGAAVLGARVIMVLGHGDCGAVKATICRQGRAGTDQLALQLYPAGGEPGERRSRRGDRGQCADPGPAAAGILHSGRGPAQGRQDQGGSRRLRPRQRQGEPARLTAFGIRPTATSSPAPEWCRAARSKPVSG